MNKTRGYRTAIALGSLTAAAALLVGMSGAQAQAPAPGAPLQGAGSFPGSFIVPGTNTSLHVGGVIEFDGNYNLDSAAAASSPGALQQENLGGMAVEGAGISQSAGDTEHGVSNLTAQFTRPNIETRTPTAYGELKTYWEIDFAGSANAGSIGTAGSTGVVGAAGSPPGGGSSASTGCCGDLSLARLKQAYGTLGPWLFGMTNSNFADLDALADSIDGAGDAGGWDFAGIRYKPQIRYTYLLPQGISLSVSVEEFHSAGLISATGNGSGAGGSATGAATGLRTATSTAAVVNGAATVGGTPNMYATPISAAAGQSVTAATAAANVDAAAALAAVQTGFITDASIPSGAGLLAVNNWDLPGMGQKLPAVTAKARIDQPWGHASLEMAVAQERLLNDNGGGAIGLGPGVPLGQHVERWGYEVANSGHFNTIGSDKITWFLSYAQGAADYNYDLNEVGTQWEEGLVCSAVGAGNTASVIAAPGAVTGQYVCSEPRVLGASAGYSHFWTPEWRSGVSVGYAQISRPNAAQDWSQPVGPGSAQAGAGLGLLEKKHYTAHANLLYSPIPAAQFGIEFQFYRRVVQSGASGDHERIAIQSIFKF